MKTPSTIDTQSSKNDEHIKLKEQWLREEIRAGRVVMLTMLRWGITLQTAVEAALYFIRRDVMLRQAIPADQPFPFFRWIVGTGIQLFLAFVFWKFTSYTMKTHVNYRAQLVAMQPSYSGIEERPSGNRLLPKMVLWLFLSFPLAAVLLWLYLLALAEHTINFNLIWKFRW